MILKVSPLNLFTTATLGTKENGRCKEVLNKTQSMEFFARRAEKQWPLYRGGC